MMTDINMNLQESIRRILRENWKDTKWVNYDYTITISDVLDYIGEQSLRKYYNTQIK